MKTTLTYCSGCSLCLLYPGFGFNPTGSYTCGITGNEKSAHGFCDEAVPGIPQFNGADYDIDISEDAKAYGEELGD